MSEELRRRRADGGWIARFADLASRHQVVISAVVAAAIGALLAMGFGLQTPADSLAALETRTVQLSRADTLLTRRQDLLANDHAEMIRMLRVLAIDVCLRRTAEQTRMMQLPCDELLRPHNRIGELR